MWLVVLAATALALIIGGFETLTVAFFPKLTITELIKRYTHLTIIVVVPLLALAFGLLGYALGVGGR